LTVNMPATNFVSVQLFLNNCSSSSPQGINYSWYDDKGQEQPIGLTYINNWGNPAAPAAGAAPAVQSGGVLLTGSGTAGTPCDPYFSTSSGVCNIGGDAQVAFNAGATTKAVRAVMGGQTIDLTNTAGTDWNATGYPLTVAPASGLHNVTLQWAQLG